MRPLWLPSMVLNLPDAQAGPCTPFGRPLSARRPWRPEAAPDPGTGTRRSPGPPPDPAAPQTPRSACRPEDASASLEELAHKLLLHTADQSALRDELLHTVACKSAIKAGMHTDPAELQALVDKVQSGAVRYCPHGRPVAVEMTRYQIEKMFKRA